MLLFSTVYNYVLEYKCRFSTNATHELGTYTILEPRLQFYAFSKIVTGKITPVQLYFTIDYDYCTRYGYRVPVIVTGAADLINKTMLVINILIMNIIINNNNIYSISFGLLTPVPVGNS